MTDEPDNQDAADEAETSDGPRAGERLADARRKQEMSVADVAKELHLDEYKIRALEQNDFDVLGAPVFAKGHLKKYAQLVRVNIDDVLADYYALDRESRAPPVVGDVRKPAREIAVGPWIVAILVVIAAAAAYWYFVTGAAPGTAAPDGPADARPVEIGDEAVQTGLPAPDPQSVEAESSEEPLEAESSEEPLEVVNEAPEAAQPAPLSNDLAEPAAAGEIRLTLRFTGDCWTEISDASGRRLFFDLGRDGRYVDVSGEAPLSVLLGNVDNVSVEVNGDDYRIEATDRRTQTARLTIQAP